MVRENMTLEDQLCLLLARGQLTPDVQKRILELLASSLQWPLILERAYTHEVYPLLYRNLRELGFPGVPDRVQATLKGVFLANALRNKLLMEELARLLHLLGEAGIPVIPLKGVTLAQSLYSDIASRVCADIDILVPRSEVLRARRLILALGYTSPFSEEFFINHQFNTSADCPLFPGKDKEVVPYLVEVHWTLLQHSSKDEEATECLWSEARNEDFFGVQAYNLTPDWQFLYLSAHAAYHKWHTLKWLADIHELCVSVAMDWAQVTEKADRFELDSVVEPTLAACSSLFDTPIPDQLSSRVLPLGVQLFPTSLAPSEAWKTPLFYPRLLKRPSDKLRWFTQMFFVARVADRRFLRLPPSLSFLYYFLRPLRLTCKWSGLLLHAGAAHFTRMFGSMRKQSETSTRTDTHGR
jgi:Uncharacterised nucleotidyltransferase